MDNDLLFLENLSNLLEQGYGIEETLLICKDINSHPSIDTILQKIYDGEDLRRFIRPTSTKIIY